jgi:DNA-binding IclR family transcriptional regulator
VKVKVAPPASVGGTSRSLDRALQILAVFSEEKPEWTVSELGKALRIPPASGYRVVQSLERGRLLRRSPNGSGYQLGLEIVRLADLVLGGLDIRDAARPVMRELAKTVGETIVLLVPGSDVAVCIEAVEGLSPIRPQSLRVGEHVAYNAGAGPLTILAYLPASERERIIASDLPRLTERTITDPAELRARCEKIGREGVAYSRSEMIPRTLAVAAPIFSGDGSPVSGAIALTGVDDRARRLPTLRGHIIAAAREISERLGGLRSRR